MKRKPGESLSCGVARDGARICSTRGLGSQIVGLYNQIEVIFLSRKFQFSIKNTSTGMSFFFRLGGRGDTPRRELQPPLPSSGATSGSNQGQFFEGAKKLVNKEIK